MLTMAEMALFGRDEELRLLSSAADFTIRQGVDMGRPSRPLVHARPDNNRVGVSGAATRIRLIPPSTQR
jgi:predicted PhzF superfamily epimerase YddE/YHI9